jgi:hypothetical protein
VIKPLSCVLPCWSNRAGRSQPYHLNQGQSPMNNYPVLSARLGIPDNDVLAARNGTRPK